MPHDDHHGTLPEPVASPRADDREAAYRQGHVPDTPVHVDVVAVAEQLAPGKALDLGSGAGQNSIWLAERGWDVLGVDLAMSAVDRARAAARWASVDVRFERDDLTSWVTDERFDLVISTYALPPRGVGRTHALTVARDAVAAGGTALVAELESGLAADGRMAEDHLATLDEVVAMFPGFHLDRAEVKVTAHRHGDDSREVPIVFVVARHPGPASAAG